MGADAEGTQVQGAVHRAPGDLELLGDAGTVGAQTGEAALVEFQGLELSALQPWYRVEGAPLQTHGTVYGGLGQVQLPPYAVTSQPEPEPGQVPGSRGRRGQQQSAYGFPAYLRHALTPVAAPERFPHATRPASHPAGGSSSTAN